MTSMLHLTPHTHTHTHTHTHSHTHTHTHSLSLSLSPTHILSLSHTPWGDANHFKLRQNRSSVPSSGYGGDFGRNTTVAVCCDKLQCVAVCCSMLQCVAVCPAAATCVCVNICMCVYM